MTRMVLLWLGLGASGCTHCYAEPVGNSSHPRTAFVEAYVGAPERFDETRCDELCRVLDHLTVLDASTLDAGAGDAGPPLYLRTPYPERVTADCGYGAEGTTLYCNYRERYCETSASCNPPTH